MRTATAIRFAAGLLSVLALAPAWAQQSLTTLDTSASPGILLVNPVTNKLFVVGTNNSVDIFDGATHARTTLFPPSAFEPLAAAINPITNKVYLGYRNDGIGITELDGATHAMTTLDPPGGAGGQSAKAVVVNPVTNKVYAARDDANEVTVFDAANSNAITRVTVAGARRLALNAVASPSRVYAIGPSNTLTEINGDTNVPTGITVGLANLNTLAVNPVTDKIYVANATQVYEVDGSTRAVTLITTLTSAPPGPNVVAIAINPATNKVYVSNGNPPGYNVTVINGTNGMTPAAVVATVPMSAANTTLVVDSVTNRVFVTNEGSNTPGLDVIDGATNAKTTLLNPENHAFFNSVAVNPVTGRVYLADQFGKVWVVDRSTYTSTLGPFSTSAAVNPITRKVYVADYNANELRVVDADTNATLATRALVATAGSFEPMALAVDPVLNKVYVVGLLGWLAVFDGATDTLLTPTSLNLGGGGIRSVSVNPVTHKVYVPMFGNSEVKVIDGVTHAVLATLPIPLKPGSPPQSAFPEAIAVNMETNRIFVANPNTNNVTVIDGTTDSIVKFIAVGLGPRDVSVNPVTNRIYTANFDGGSVSEILGGTIDDVSPTVNSRPVTGQVTGVAVNPVTNKIFGARTFDGAFVLDGATGVVTPIQILNQQRHFVSVDPLRNKAYLANEATGNFTILDGTTLALINTNYGASAQTPVVDPVTGKVFVTGSSASLAAQLAIIDPAPTAFTKHQPSAGLVVGSNGATSQASPNLTVAVGGAYTPTDPAVQKLYFRKGDLMGAHSTGTGSGPYTAALSGLAKGLNYVSLFALDAMTATAMSTESQLAGNGSTQFGASPTVTGAPKVFAFVYTGPPEITTASLPNGVLGSAYNQALRSFGGVGTIGHTVPPATLPTGLSLSSAGAITGTPIDTGTFNFPVTATDSLGTIGTRSLSITVNAPAVLTLNPTTTVGFGSIVAGNTTAASSVTVTNDGGLTLTVGTPAITGTNAGDFALSSNNCTTLAPAATCTLQFTFSPSGAGARAATVTVPNDGGATTDNQVGLSGTGIAQDTTPNAFSFTDATGVARNSQQTSVFVTIAGINFPAAISVSGGSYSIGCTVTYVTGDSTIANNQTVCVRHTASALHATTTNTILTVGGVSDTFSSTTLAGFTITAAANGTGTGTIAGTGFNCPGDCAELLDPTAQVTLTATPSAGSVFAGWAGCNSVVTNQCTVTASADKTVTATFTALVVYNVVLEGWQQVAPYVVTSASGAGTATWNPVAHTLAFNLAYSGLSSGESMAHIHGPAARGANAGVLINLQTGSPKTEQVVLNAAQETQLQAGQLYVNVHTATYPSGEIRGQLDNVGATVTRTLTVTKAGTGSGTVAGTGEPGNVVQCGLDCGEVVPQGKSVQLTATPTAGSVFAGWGGACTGTGGCNVTMDAAKSVTATFNAPGVSLSATSLDFGGQSMGTTSPAMPITITNTGSADLMVSGLSIDNGQFVQASGCTTVAPTASCTANVTFTPVITGAALNASNPAAGTLSIASNATGSPHTVALSGTGEKSLVTHYYRSILRRAPDGGGAAFWAADATRLQQIGANVNEAWFAMAQFFYFSEEYLGFNRDDNGFVTDLYTTFFNRAPDGGGLNFWVANLQQGMPREVLLASFMFSAEFAGFTQAIFGNTTARAEVDVVMDFYRGLLARTPDPDGFTAWVNNFRSAQCAGTGVAVVDMVEAISSGFAGSGEYTGRNRTNAQYVGDLYNAFLRRGGDLGGVQFWINEIATATRTRDNVRQQFIASSEFQGRVSAVIAQGCSP